MKALKVTKFKKLLKLNRSLRALRFGKLKNFQTSIILALIGLALIGVGLSVGKLFVSKPPPQFINSNQNTSQTDQIVVNISGAVEKPGVYSVDAGSRLVDLIEKAGGFARSADKTWVDQNLNLAEKLTDGQKVYIPTIGSQGQVSGAITGKINVNTAAAEQLDTLPGVGPVTAEKIISGRPYRAVEDLLNQKVVGAATFEKIKDKIAVY